MMMPMDPHRASDIVQQALMMAVNLDNKPFFLPEPSSARSAGSSRATTSRSTA